MRKLMVAIFVLATLGACTSNNDFNQGKRQLESRGYTNIQNTGYEMFCCSDSDDFKTGFKATDRDGVEVTGCFCSAITKGLTIRYN